MIKTFKHMQTATNICTEVLKFIKYFFIYKLFILCSIFLTIKRVSHNNLILQIQLNSRWG